MSDITLTLDGDPAGASAALQKVGDDTERLHKQATSMGDAQRKQSEEFWGGVVKMAAAASAAVVAFGVSSVKAFMEADKVQRQLTRAAGEYAGALSEQASALQQLYAIDDDLIKQSQVLLTQWGGVGAAQENVTRAVLDYAAATGKDAVAATQDLIRNVESGGVGLAKMGVHFDATGDKGEDLARMIDALNKKFGGAAAADADSLHGQLSAVGLAFEDLQEDIGGSIAKFAAEHGIVTSLTEAIKGMRTAAFGSEGEEKRAEQDSVNDQLLGRLEHRKTLLAELQRATDEGSTATIAQAQRIYVENEKAIRQLREWRGEFNAGQSPTPAVTGDTNQKTKEDEAAAAARATKTAADQKKNMEDWKKYLQGMDDLEEASRVKDQEDYADDLAMSAKRVEMDIKEGEDRLAVAQLFAAKDLEHQRKAEAKKQETVARFFAESNESNLHAMQAQVDRWQNAGSQIGEAFVNALGTQLEALANGGEFDVTAFLGDVLGAAIGVAASALSIAFPAAAPLIGAIGNVANMGVKYGFASMKGSGKAKPVGSFHDGGWVGDEPRHHGGAWIGADEQRAILQTGERVLSRKEVHHMGGPKGVDSAAKGGGPSVVVHLQAIDSKTAADSFASDLGDGMRDAQRRGLGALPALLNAGPR